MLLFQSGFLQKKLFALSFSLLLLLDSLILCILLSFNLRLVLFLHCADLIQVHLHLISCGTLASFTLIDGVCDGVELIIVHIGTLWVFLEHLIVSFLPLLQNFLQTRLSLSLRPIDQLFYLHTALSYLDHALIESFEHL
jgi:hypothetical protein